MNKFWQKAIEKVITLLGGFLPKPAFESLTWCVAEYTIDVYEGDPGVGKLVDSTTLRNVVVDDGRKQVLKHVLGITTPAPPVNFPYLGVGSGTTPNVPPESATALQTELTGNATRKTLLNTSDVTLSDSDITFEVSGSFRWKVVAQATFTTGDGNNGSTFAEYGIFSNPTFAMGLMYNRFIHPSPFVKSGSLSVVVKLTLRA